MIKVNILDKCEFCDGEAYVPIGEAVSADGERYIALLTMRLLRRQWQSS